MTQYSNAYLNQKLRNQRDIEYVRFIIKNLDNFMTQKLDNQTESH